MMGVAKSTNYDIIKRVEQENDVTHAGQGKSAVKITEARKIKVIKAVRNRVPVNVFWPEGLDAVKF